MIGLDTNVLVRLLTGDDPRQQKIAKTFIAQHCSAEIPAFINRVVLIETVWVLESVYEYSRAAIGLVLEALLRTANVSTESSDDVRVVLGAYRDGADFADALIARTNAGLGCTKTITFDRKAAKRVTGFEAL